MEESRHSNLELRTHLHRLARFGANISDAHSCFIFLPDWLFSQNALLQGSNKQAQQSVLTLGGYHSLSQSVVDDCKIPSSSGLIGWVVRNERTIHVSPFERDSRTLGIYEGEQELKSFIGIPIQLDIPHTASHTVGALVGDSKKSFAFSKLHGKLLEDLSQEISSVLNLLFSHEAKAEGSWRDFVHNTNKLIDALGAGAIEVLRVSCVNFRKAEHELGSHQVFDQLNQIQKLVVQTLPEHFPSCLMPNGDLVVALDRMMAGFYSNRIEALCEHISSSLPVEIQSGSSSMSSSTPALVGAQENRTRLEFTCLRKSFSRRAFRAPNIEQLVGELASEVEKFDFEESQVTRDRTYGNRRA